MEVIKYENGAYETTLLSNSLSASLASVKVY